jgi:protein-disulfide isomerase
MSRTTRSGRHRGLAMVGVGAALVFAACSPTTPSVGPVAAGRDNTRGLASAPVVIEEWGDYQCPACGAFARLQPQLDQTLIADGSARFSFHNMAFLGTESGWAAEAAECAGDQGGFWEYHDRLYASQAAENRGAFGKEHLKQFAAGLVADQAAFNACLDTDRYASQVQVETERGRRLGVNSTPTIFVNGQKVVLTNSRSPLETIGTAVRNARPR